MRGEELANRLRFDHRILTDMRCPTFAFESYRTSWDLDRRSGAIDAGGETGEARKYRFILRVPTLISPTEWAPETEIGVDVDVNDYPGRPPNTFVLSPHIPWSPHFKRGSPVCIGPEFWEGRRGHVVLGDLVIHLQRLLNWDEKGRGPGYQGWNRDAIRHHNSVLGGRPLDDSVVYARLPLWLNGGESKLEFAIEGRFRQDPGFEVL